MDGQGSIEAVRCRTADIFALEDGEDLRADPDDRKDRARARRHTRCNHRRNCGIKTTHYLQNTDHELSKASHENKRTDQTGILKAVADGNLPDVWPKGRMEIEPGAERSHHV